jgi:pyridinium-3,5-bisthiocarboxylic acid mononucleotide nickel chelatase
MCWEAVLYARADKRLQAGAPFATMRVISILKGGGLMFEHNTEHTEEGMVLIQANLDDMNPEWCSFVMDKLFEAGANDVYWIPIVMKKGRPGFMLNVLCSDDRLGKMEDVIFQETTTLGLRYLRADCHRLGRSFVKVETPWGLITVKTGHYKGELVQAAPEFKDCEEAARTFGVPLKRVYEVVRQLFAATHGQEALGKKVAE